MQILNRGVRDLAYEVGYNIRYGPYDAFSGIYHRGPRFAKQGMGMLNYEVAALKAEKAGNKVEFQVMMSNYTSYNNTEAVCKYEFGGQLAKINTENEAAMVVALVDSVDRAWGRQVWIESVEPSLGKRYDLTKYTNVKDTNCAKSWREFQRM